MGRNYSLFRFILPSATTPYKCNKFCVLGLMGGLKTCRETENSLLISLFAGKCSGRRVSSRLQAPPYHKDKFVTGSELKKSFDSAGDSPIVAKHFLEEKLTPVKKSHARDCSPILFGRGTNALILPRLTAKAEEIYRAFEGSRVCADTVSQRCFVHHRQIDGCLKRDVPTWQHRPGKMIATGLLLCP
jgi:hypothetical protein